MTGSFPDPFQSHWREKGTLGFPSLPVAMFRVDTFGYFTGVNDWFEELTGHPLQSMGGKEWWHFFCGSGSNSMGDAWRKAVAEGRPFPFQGQCTKSDGSVVWIKGQLAMALDEQGLFSHVGIVINITDHQQTQVQLEATQTRLQSLVHAIPGKVVRVNRTGECLEYVSKPIPVDEQPPHRQRFIFSPADAWQTMVDLALDTKTVQVFEQNLPQEWGSRVEEVRIIPLQQEEALLVITDISETKRIQRSLQESEANYRLLVEHQTDLVVKVDLNGRLTFVSPSYCQLFGKTQTELLHQPYLPLVHEADRQATEEARQTLRHPPYTCYVEQRVMGEGGWHWLAWSSRAILNEQGDVTATVGIGRDISQLKQFQQDLHQLNEELEQRVQERTQQLEQSNQELARATHLKDEFLTTMSHELRTPLNTILGMAESMREQVFGEINGEQRLALETIERSSYHLLDLMNDILDVSKIASGQMELNLTATPIHLLCESSLSFIKQQAIKKGISIQTHFPPHIPQLVVDERRMRQVLINLLENAVKFTPPGGVISVHVSLASSPCPSQYSIHAPQTILSPTVVRIAIQDTGIGIAPEDTERIFQPFFQVARSLSRPYDGTGLGLGLVKRLVEMHGGQVGLSSQVGVGSCFTIDLPCQTPQFSGDDPTGPEGVTGSTDGALELPIRSGNQRDKQGQPLILLVENNPINTCTVSNYLTANGYEVLTAGNGDEAIILAQSRIPNLILMDIQMPGINGREIIHHIRTLPILAPIPIIALSAQAVDRDRQPCLAAGATHFLLRPLRLKQLRQAIHHLLEGGVENPPPPPS